MYPHHESDVRWRLSAIRKTLDKLPMYCACWHVLEYADQIDVRLEWSGVLRDIEYITSLADRIARGADVPEWYWTIMVEIEEHERILRHLNLDVP
jgi:hypothetical protein